MSDKEKKFYQYMIYGVSGFGALLSLIFGICNMCLHAAMYGCIVMFFGFMGSAGAYLLLTFLLEIVCELKSKKEENQKEDTDKN